MAQIVNIATKGMSGMIGGTLVFRKVNGKTVVASAPVPSSKPPSEGQMQQRERFRLATLYGQRVMNDPLLNEEYAQAAIQKKMPSAQIVAIADYFRLPEILSFAVSTHPKGSSVLETIVIDYVMVKTVTVDVKDPDGLVLESGNGLMGIDKQTWTYEIQNAENLVAGVQFEITATNLPGNVTVKSFDYQD